LADTFNAELVTVNTTEGAAYGAALLAGVGAGIWSDTDTACETCVKITGKTPVQDEFSPVYEDAYLSYVKLYPALKPTWSVD
jgi:xylulokinase